MPHASRTINKKQLTRNFKFSQLSNVRCQLFRPGFTLIEIAFASMFLLAIVAIFLAGSGSFIHNRGSYLQSVATEIASCEIERLRNLAFDALPTEPLTIPAQCNPTPSKLPAGYTAGKTINNYSGSDIKIVTITITWKLNNANKNLKVETLISKYGL